jgi:hypothetical protein
MKYCIIRKVAFKWPGKPPRIVWANVICERNGLALVLVPKTEDDQLHAIFFAEENISERVFEPVGSHRFDLTTADMRQIGITLKVLSKEYWEPPAWLTENPFGFDPDDFL